MDSCSPACDQHYQSHPGRPTPPASYCAVPQRLLADLRDTPLAIGLYALAARLFLVTHEPVPLSRADVMRYDPTLKPGAVKRAFDRLAEAGWLVVARDGQQKLRYTPTWGRVRGTPAPWRADAACLGRPRHITRLMLDRNLLDVCMGKLTPHPTRPGTVTRYITAPALGLADVGSYALALGAIPHETHNLRQLGLVCAGAALPLPAASHLLALISQLALDKHAAASDIALTLSGSRRLGVVSGKPADTAQPLFFVPPEMIGSLIGPLIGGLIGETGCESNALTASAWPKPHSLAHPDRVTWETSDPGKGAITPVPPMRSQPAPGGGDAWVDAKQARLARHAAQPPQKHARHEIPATPATQLLQTINVLPQQQIELAELPVAIVQAAIDDAKTRPGIRDLAGWVVTLLRSYRDHGWNIAPPPARADSPAALRASFARYAAEQAAPARVDLPPDQASLMPPAPVPVNAPGGLTRIWNEVLAALKAQVPRAAFDAWLRPLRLFGVENGLATITAPSKQAKSAIENRYLGMLRELLTTVAGTPIEARVILSPHASALHNVVAAVTPAASNDTRPAWIAAERWAVLPVMLRAVLADSTLADGQVHGRDPWCSRLLQSRYKSELEALVTAAKT